MNQTTGIELLLCGFYGHEHVNNGNICADICQLLGKMMNIDPNNELKFLLTTKQHTEWKIHENNFVESSKKFHIKKNNKHQSIQPKRNKSHRNTKHDVFIVRTSEYSTYCNVKYLTININNKALKKGKLNNNKIKSMLFELCQIQFTTKDIYTFMVKNKFIIKEDDNLMICHDLMKIDTMRCKYTARVAFNERNVLTFYNKLMEDAQKQFTVRKIDSYCNYGSDEWQKQCKMEYCSPRFTVHINKGKSICFKLFDGMPGMEINKKKKKINKKEFVTQLRFIDIESIDGKEKSFNEHYQDYSKVFEGESKIRTQNRFFISIIDKYYKQIQLMFKDEHIDEGKVRLAYLQLFHQYFQSISC